MLCWPPGPHTPTHSFQGDDRYTLTKYQQRHPQDSLQDGVGSTHRDTSRRRFVASKGSEVQTHRPQTYSEQAGIQLKARHNFLTLLAHKSKYRMAHSTYTTTQTGQECVLRERAGQAGALVLRESRAGKRPLTLLTGLQLPRWAHPPLTRPPIAESSTSSPLHCVAPPASLSPSETRLFYWPIRHKISTWPQTPALSTTSAPMSSLPIW